MTRDCLTEFRTLFQELKQFRSVEIIVEKIIPEREEGLAEFAVRDLTQLFGFDVPEHYVDYIDVSLDTHLRFVYYIGGQVAGGGEFHLRPLYDTLVSTKDPGLWHKGMDQQEIEFVKQFRIFDDHPDAGDFKMAVFYMTPGKCPPAIPDIYFYDRGQYWKMDGFDYGDYLDGLLGLFGVSNWQYIFCDIDMSQPEFESVFNELNTTLLHLSDLFPERDFEPYKKLLSQRQGGKSND